VCVKPDQLIKRRGKGGLILLNADIKQANLWLENHAGKEVQVGSCLLFVFLVLLLGGRKRE